MFKNNRFPQGLQFFSFSKTLHLQRSASVFLIVLLQVFLAFQEKNIRRKCCVSSSGQKLWASWGLKFHHKLDFPSVYEVSFETWSFIICCYLLYKLLLTHVSSDSAQNFTTVVSTVETTTKTPPVPGYQTIPANVTVAAGEPVEFRCGVSKAAPNLTFTLYGSHGNYSLKCPDGHIEDIPQVRHNAAANPIYINFIIYLLSILLWFFSHRVHTYEVIFLIFWFF